jgi:predicted amidohydrolase
MYGPTCIFWANLTTFSLQLATRALENGVDIAMANHLSFEGEPPFSMNGNSPAYDFAGRA